MNNTSSKVSSAHDSEFDPLMLEFIAQRGIELDPNTAPKWLAYLSSEETEIKELFLLRLPSGNNLVVCRTLALHGGYLLAPYRIDFDIMQEQGNPQGFIPRP